LALPRALRVALRACGLVLLSACLAAVCIAAQPGLRARLLWMRPGAEVGLEHAEEHRCGVSEEGTDYTLPLLRTAGQVHDAGACCAECQEEPKCRAWTWTEHHHCELKTLLPAQPITKLPKPGYTSGLPFTAGSDSSLYCFALMLPGSYEQELLNVQQRAHVSLFACDEHSVYSNVSVKLAPGVRASVVDSNLHCVKGGEFRTALNLDIFIAVWRKVVLDGRFKFHAWTVKVDPDAVFFPERLRVVVYFHQDHYNGLYLNNCKLGMHGPLEVLSRAAVERWTNGIEPCVQHFRQLCSGDCQWGEDMFIDQCLSKFLMVRRDDDWNLLSEPHCESEDWEACGNGRVAFHPFKGLRDYLVCLQKADFGALPHVV